MKIPIIGEKNVLEATDFDLGTPTQGRNSCGQGLALAERLGWGGVGPLWFNHFLEDPKQSQTLSRP